MLGGAKRRKSSSRKTRKKSTKRGPKSLGEVMRNVPETKDTFLNWLAEMKNQGKLESLIAGVRIRQPPRGAPPDVKERYEFTNVMIKLFKLSKIPQLEKAIRSGKDPMKIIEKVKNPIEREFYEEYIGIK